MVPSPSRRASRRQQSSVNYSVNPLEDVDVGEGPDPYYWKKQPKKTGDDDFDPEQEPTADHVEQEDDVLSLVEDEEHEQGDEASAHNGDSDHSVSQIHRKKRGTGRPEDHSGDEPEPHSRGIHDPLPPRALDSYLLHYAGAATEDQDMMHEMYMRAQEAPIVPARDKMLYSPFGREAVSDETLANEWQWYGEGGGSRFFKNNQNLKHISAADALRYMPSVDNGSQTVLVGPFDKQRLETLTPNVPVNIANFFTSKKSSGEPLRNAWMLKLGRSIKHLQWLPNRSNQTQFLCVSVPQHESSQNEDVSAGPKQPPSFFPSDGFPACMQIWAFEGIHGHNGSGELNLHQEPYLAYVICTDWGNLNNFAWCPIPRRQADTSTSPKEVCELGLVAGVWSDGKVRVLDLSLPSPKVGETQYYHVTQSAFEVTPQSPQCTVCTTLTWISGNNFAIAMSGGAVGIWSLLDTMSAPPGSNPKPWWYELLHHTYINSIASGWPSNPHLLGTTGLDGYVRLTDIRCPNFDFVTSPRSRIGTSAIAYSDNSQSFVLPEERDLKCSTIRLFYKSHQIMKSEGAFITTVATSPWHTSALYGLEDGLVGVANALRKVMDRETMSWTQIWFTHEWKKGPEQEQSQYDQNVSMLEQLLRASGTEDTIMEEATEEKEDDAPSSTPPQEQELDQDRQQDPDPSLTPERSLQAALGDLANASSSDFWGIYQANPSLSPQPKPKSSVSSRLIDPALSGPTPAPAPAAAPASPPKAKAKTKARAKARAKAKAKAKAKANTPTFSLPSLCRILDSYKPQARLLGMEKGGKPDAHSWPFFPAETAVTCLDWNHNEEFAGWAAAGMGSGIVRVEDLASG